MDIADHFGLEFLDLTDVDEHERNRVLSSLQPLQLNVRFPWFIGDGKTNIEGIKSTNKSSAESLPQHVVSSHNYMSPSKAPITIVDPANGFIVPLNSQTEPIPVVANPIINNAVNGPGDPQYYSNVPQYYTPPPAVATIPSVPVHIPPTSYGHYPPTTHPEIAPAYPPYIPATYPGKTPVFYGVPQAQTIFVPHPTENPGYFSSNSFPAVEATVASKKPVSPLSADSPAFTPKNQQIISSNVEVVQKPIEIQKPMEEPPSTVPAQAAPSAPKQAGKSWASLFTPKKGSASPEVNGAAKPAFSEAVTKESNNNEVTCPIKNPRRNHFIDPDCYRMGEFLSNYTVDGRAISLQPRGLINQSNYCYINSILQALIACPPMYNLLSGLAENISSNAKRKPTPVIDGMCKFVKEYKHLPANMRVTNRRSEGNKKDQKKEQGAMINTDIPFEPSWIYKMLHGLQTDLMEGRQEDAEEFLGCLLNSLSDEMLELIRLIENSEKTTLQETEDDEDLWQVMGNKNKGSVLRKTEFQRTPITDIFGGSLKSKINRIGGVVTENTQPFLTLPLNIEKVKTVREAIEALTTKYQLEGLTSSKTNEEVEAWQQVMLDELPVVLVLHLKCFDFKLDGCTKIVKALEFPIDLKIDGKLLSLKTTNAKEKQYKLFAVVYHDGKEATKGHYVTDAFHVGYSSWLRYDDASVKPVQEEQVLNPQGTRVPYLLFYRRSDSIRSR